MSSKHAELFAALAAPFEGDEVKVRSQQGRQLHYITARVAMNRLDSVLGPENWWDDYEAFGGGVKCLLTVRLPDGTTITKAGIGGITPMHDASDSDKTGESDAIKRAAVKFGVARYLYRDGVPDFVADYHGEPSQPEPPRQAPQRQHEAPRQDGEWKQYDGPPRSGKGLFAALKKLGDETGMNWIKYANDLAKLQDIRGRMVDWELNDVLLVWNEVQRKSAASQAAPDNERPY